MGDDTYTSRENFYNGGISSFSANYGEKENWGTYIPGKSSSSFSSYLGFPGHPTSANQINEAVKAIRQGVKSFEVSLLDPNEAEAIPKQHFQEMKALMKLTGVKPSVHAPIMGIDPSGFTQQGYDEDERKQNERRFFDSLERAHELDYNEKGNIPVVFHSSVGLPGNQYRPGNEKDKEERWHLKKVPLVNREDGKIVTNVEEERKIEFSSPQDFKDGGTLHKPMEDINSVNSTLWRQNLTELAQYKKMTDEVLGNSVLFLADYNKMKIEGKSEDEIIKQMNQEGVAQYYSRMKDAQSFLQNTHLKFNSAFELAYKYGNDEQKKELKGLAEKYKEEVKKSEGTILHPIADKSAMDAAIGKLNEITFGKEINDPYNPDGEKVRAVPQLIIPLEDFAREKAAETFGSLAFNAYNKWGDKAPVVAVENMFAGEWAHSTGEGMKKLIDESRKKFVDNATKKGMDKDEAKKAAEKLIGMTWDVGHLNMMKKHGFTDKDVIEETKKVAPYVKHIHLTDNFGYADSHLAPGMGNVPIKQILEELEKKGKIAEMSKIVEAGGFVKHFQKSPHSWTLAAMGSPIYGAMQGPYWNQVTGMAAGGGGYFGTPLAYMPEKHFSIYGSGFSSLPAEVGGQLPGTASRFSGTANA